jgi:conjugative transfer signal peptidase TraF
MSAWSPKVALRHVARRGVSPFVEMQPTYAERQAPRRVRALALMAAILVPGSALLGLVNAHRATLLINPSPSEPPGVYVRATDAPVRVGELIAFLAPPAAFPYADRRMAYLHRTPILKAVAATAGDEVCTLGGELRINGLRRAPIVLRDRRGDALPRWAGCRRLLLGEVFVFSNRVPNSFDSRYFGPVRAKSAMVYRPLVTTRGLGR